MDIKIEPELPENRNTPFHKHIVSWKRIPNTKTGKICQLECGHQNMVFGDLRHSNGVLLCMQCRDGASGVVMMAKS